VAIFVKAENLAVPIIIPLTPHIAVEKAVIVVISVI
jgi:hypothetical protein